MLGPERSGVRGNVGAEKVGGGRISTGARICASAGKASEIAAAASQSVAHTACRTLVAPTMAMSPPSDHATLIACGAQGVHDPQKR